MVTRRTVLSSLTTIGVTSTFTGCLWDTSNDSSLAIHLETVSRRDLGQINVVDEGELTPRARSVFSEGLTNGTIAFGTQPFESGEVVHSGGSYYAVQVSENGTEAVQWPVLDATEVSTANGSVSDWGNLSRSDAYTLRCAVSSRGNPCPIYAGNHSVFWPELRFRYLESGDETYYRLQTSEQTVTLDRYRYTFEPVAANRSAFVDYAMRELVAIDFSTVNLSAKQRDILATAAEEGTYRESPPPYSAALEGLVDRLKSVYGPETSVYVRFNGNYYEARHTQSFDD